MVLADMLDQVVDGTVSVACRVLDLRANLAERLALPRHITRGEMPDRVARHAGRIEIGLLVTDRAAQRRQPIAIGSAFDRRLVEPSLLTAAEAGWLDGYHRLVAERLGPLLGGESLDWLSRATRPIAEGV